MSAAAYLAELEERIAYLIEVASVPPELVDDDLDGAGRAALLAELQEAVEEIEFAKVVAHAWSD